MSFEVSVAVPEDCIPECCKCAGTLSISTDVPTYNLCSPLGDTECGPGEIITQYLKTVAEAITSPLNAKLYCDGVEVVASSWKVELECIEPGTCSHGPPYAGNANYFHARNPCLSSDNLDVVFEFSDDTDPNTTIRMYNPTGNLYFYGTGDTWIWLKVTATYAGDTVYGYVTANWHCKIGQSGSPVTCP